MQNCLQVAYSRVESRVAERSSPSRVSSRPSSQVKIQWTFLDAQDMYAGTAFYLISVL